LVDVVGLVAIVANSMLASFACGMGVTFLLALNTYHVVNY